MSSLTCVSMLYSCVCIVGESPWSNTILIYLICDNFHLRKCEIGESFRRPASRPHTLYQAVIKHQKMQTNNKLQRTRTSLQGVRATHGYLEIALEEADSRPPPNKLELEWLGNETLHLRKLLLSTVNQFQSILYQAQTLLPDNENLEVVSLSCLFKGKKPIP